LCGTTTVVWRDNKPDWWATAANVNISGTNHENNTMKIVFPHVHPSEWSWAGWEFDHTIYNTSTLEDLQSRTLEVFA